MGLRISPDPVSFSSPTSPVIQTSPSCSLIFSDHPMRKRWALEREMTAEQVSSSVAIGLVRLIAMFAHSPFLFRRV